MIEETAEVVEREELGDRFLWLGLRSPRTAASARPGQFAMVSPQPRGVDSLDPFLRRPLSVALARGETIHFLLERRGRGTRALGELEPGDEVSLLGPLGRGFSLEGKAVGVGGGVGAAPLLFLAVEGGLDLLLLGFRDRSSLALSSFVEERLGKKVAFAFEDGSTGRRGTVLDLLGELGRIPGRIAACGPEGMLSALARWCEGRGVDLEVSLERRMGCGFGGCLSCSIPTRAGRRRVCVDGPVFDAKELILHEL